MPASIGESESSCTRCALCQTRTQVVIGRGNQTAAVFFLAEAPGREEDRLGQGFQGAAGQRFNRILEFIGLQREDVWLANAVRCRPSVNKQRNRTPRPEEIAACRHWLVRDIQQVRPRLIVTLGRVAFESVSGRVWSQENRAVTITVQEFNLPVFALYHPAYLIYRRNLLETYRQDLIALKETLISIGVPINQSFHPNQIFR